MAQVRERPSTYMHRNVFVGASFLSRSEAARDSRRLRRPPHVRSDYPHVESTFQYPGTDDFDDAESIGRMALRFTFAGVPRTRCAPCSGSPR
jgi:hypothetical protein